MKLKKQQQEFIKQAYDEVCSDWKVRIREAFPKLFENELEVGSWYNTNLGLFYFEKRDEDRKYGYGFYGQEWKDNLYYQDEFDERYRGEYIPATEQEVEKALIKEAKKRGFKNGVLFRDVIYKSHDYLQGEDFEFVNGVLENKYGDKIFTSGKWAEIIETITKKEAEKQLGKKIID